MRKSLFVIVVVVLLLLENVDAGKAKKVKKVKKVKDAKRVKKVKLKARGNGVKAKTSKQPDKVKIFCFEPFKENVAMLKCNKPFTIHVEYANYGRTSVKECPSAKGQTETTTCNTFAERYTEDMRQKCGGKRSCKYSYPQPHLGRPCPEVRKYLEVRYQCKKCGYQKYGKWCQKRCSCASGRCHPKSGTCWGSECDPGWQGKRCNKGCPKGTFGSNCLQKCSQYCLTCDPKKGCKECVDGRTNLPECQPVCPSGKYGLNGQNCTDCGNCADKEPCDANTGECPNGCNIGYYKSQCNTPCLPGKWGHGCSNDCGKCFQGEPCDPTTGHCKKGCDFGFSTRLCNVGLNHFPTAHAPTAPTARTTPTAPKHFSNCSGSSGAIKH